MSKRKEKLKGWTIERVEYVDEYGEKKNEHFQIYRVIPFLFYWTTREYVKHEECGWGDCYNVTTKFSTLEKAQEYSDRVLCKGAPIQSKVSTDIKPVEC